MATMTLDSVENVVILGSGPAGLTAAIYAARANLNPLIFEGPQPGGLLTTTSTVENFPGFPDGIQGTELIERMKKQAENYGARFSYDSVDEVKQLYQKEEGRHALFELVTSMGDKVRSKTMIIATGASPKLTGVPGESEYFGGKGVSTCATCDAAFYHDVPVAVIGGGDSACEEALFLTRFASVVYLIHRRDTLRASPIMAQRVLSCPKIVPVWNHVTTEMVGSPETGITGIRLTHTETTQQQFIHVKGIFVAIGHTPNIAKFDIIRQCGREQGLFVAGDCIDSIYRQAITAAGGGCQAAMDAERYLAHHC